MPIGYPPGGGTPATIFFTIIDGAGNAVVTGSNDATILNLINVGTVEDPIYNIQANILPRTNTLANLKTVASGGGELMSSTDSAAIVQANGTSPGGTTAVYSPMQPGIWTDSTWTLKAPDGITGSTNGKTLTLKGGDNSASAGTAGRVNITGGASLRDAAAGGTVSISAGHGTKDGGGINAVAGGGGATGTGGGVNFTAGYGNTGGAITFTGAGGTTTAGDIVFSPTSNDDEDSGGHIIFQDCSLNSILEIDGLVDGVSGGIGFFGAPPVMQQIVTGSKVSGAALISLLGAMATLGIIIDSTTT